MKKSVSPRFFVAVDVGGTFTDLVAVDLVDGELYKVKVKSTPSNPEEGFINSVKRFLEQSRTPPSSINMVIHINTIGTNLFRGQLGLRVPKTALLTTAGFRDILEIGRQNRPELYNIFYKRPEPLIPRERRLEVRERVDAKGNVLHEVSVKELQEVANVLKGDGVESVAISFINSYINPHNERIAKEYLTKGLDTNTRIFASHEVDPEHREYERTSTTVVNAVLAPVVAKYMAAVKQALEGLGIVCPIQIMSSAGGLMDVDEAISKPVACIESGPAAGVIGAAELARALGVKNVISLDMGGTTAKAGIVVDGHPLYVPEIEVGGRAHMGRLVKGSGYPVRYPSVDLAEVSAGGGTIIDVDESGSLIVGPFSAGAVPGPACYGLGGTMPTITDANLLLGRLESLLGGEMRLRKDLAESAMQSVANRVGSNMLEAASAAITLVNLQMARAVHLVSLERGYNPSEFMLVAFGGAGPMHAAELAQQIGISKVIIPPHPGLFSSLGLLMTDFRYTFVKGFIKLLTPGDEEFFEKIFSDMELEALEHISRKGLETGDVIILRSLDMRYHGQGYELEVRVGRPFKVGEAVSSFENLHEAVYGFRHGGEEVEVTAARLNVIITRVKPGLKGSKPPDGFGGIAERRTYLGGEWLDTSVYFRDSLTAGFSSEGPAIVEEYDSTTVVPPGWRIRVLENGCMVLEKI